MTAALSRAATLDSVLNTISGSHVYADNGAYTVTVTVSDDDGASMSDTLLVTVSNVAPDVDAGENQGVDEGDMVTLSGSFSDVGSADTHTATINWGDGSAVEAATLDSVLNTISGSHVYADNGAYTVTVTVSDDDGASMSDTLTVTVSNVAPDVDAGADQGVDEGDTVTLSGSFSDVGSADTHTATIDWGDGSAVEAATLDSVLNTISGSHVYADNGAYTVTVTVSDDDGASMSDTLTVTVSNVAPVVDAGADQGVDEGDTVTLSGNFTDVGSADTHTATINWGDGSTVEAATLDSVLKTISGSHVYADNGAYTVTVTVSDDDGASSSDTLTVTVSNVAPTVSANTGTVTIDEGATASNTGTFGDVGADTVSLTASVGNVVDTGNGTWSWSFASADGPDESATVTITATDSDGAVTTTTFDLVVNNVAPTVSADNATVTIAEGDTASNSGSYGDVGADTVSLTASVGNVVDNGNGTWSWSFASTDGPDNSQTVTITATDSDGVFTTTTFELVVNNVAPIALVDQVTVDEGASIEMINVLDNDTDAGQDTLRIIAITQGSHGSVEQNADGTLSYTHNGSETLSDTFTYTIEDDEGATSVATVNVTINPVNDAPVAVNDSVTTMQGTAVSGNVLTNDTDAENHGLTVTGYDAVSANGATVVFDDNGNYTYTPATGFFGADSFTYTISDGNGGTDTATVDVTVDEAPPMSVHTITAGLANVSKGRKKARVTVIVHDHLGNVLSGATVTIQLSEHYNSEELTGVTDENGKVVLTSGVAKKLQSNYIATVTDVAHPTYSYVNTMPSAISN